MNLQIEKTKLLLINQINESNLPVAVVELILKDLLHDVTNLKDELVKKELEEENKNNGSNE